MRNVLAVIVGGSMALFCMRAEAQKRVTVEVFELEVRADVAAQYQLTVSGEVTKERRDLQAKFFDALGLLAKEKKVKLLEAVRIDAVDGKRAEVRNLGETWYLVRQPGGPWRLKSAKEKDGMLVAVTPHVEEGRIVMDFVWNQSRIVDRVYLEALPMGVSGVGSPVLSERSTSSTLILDNGKPERLGWGGEFRLPAVIPFITAFIEPDAPAK